MALASIAVIVPILLVSAVAARVSTASLRATAT